MSTVTSLYYRNAGNENVELTVGEGPDHGRFDVYIGGSLWETIDGYAASAAERIIPIPLSNDGPFTLEVNNRADKGSASSGYMMRFKQLSVDTAYTLQTIKYTYDAASRMLDANYYPGENAVSTPVVTFVYGYDIAGNLTDNNGTACTFNKLKRTYSYSERHIARTVVKLGFCLPFGIRIVKAPVAFVAYNSAITSHITGDLVVIHRHPFTG